MKPIIHLLGNKFVARRYLWFAEKKLKELKMVMDLQRLKFGQRMYRLPDSSIEVFIQSYLGVDKIRIAAVKVEAVCSVGFTADVVSGSNPLTVKYTANTSSAECGFNFYLWNFGDSVSRGLANKVDSSTVTHVYTETGLFTAKLTGLALTNTIYSAITAKSSLSDYYEATGYAPYNPLPEIAQQFKGGVDFNTVSNAAAYAEFTALPWNIATQINESCEYRGLHGFGDLGWLYDAEEGSIGFQMESATEILPLLTFFPSKFETFNTGPEINVNANTITNVLTEAFYDEFDQTWAPIADLGDDYKNNAVHSFICTDKDGYPILNPGGPGTTDGWGGFLSINILNYTKKANATKTDFITVT